MTINLRSFYAMFLASLLFTSLAFTAEVKVKIEAKPRLTFSDESTILAKTFWPNLATTPKIGKLFECFNLLKSPLRIIKDKADGGAYKRLGEAFLTHPMRRMIFIPACQRTKTDRNKSFEELNSFYEYGSSERSVLSIFKEFSDFFGDTNPFTQLFVDFKPVSLRAGAQSLESIYEDHLKSIMEKIGDAHGIIINLRSFSRDELRVASERVKSKSKAPKTIGENGNSDPNFAFTNPAFQMPAVNREQQFEMNILEQEIEVAQLWETCQRKQQEWQQLYQLYLAKLNELTQIKALGQYQYSAMPMGNPSYSVVADTQGQPADQETKQGKKRSRGEKKQKQNKRPRLEEEATYPPTSTTTTTTTPTTGQQVKMG